MNPDNEIFQHPLLSRQSCEGLVTQGRLLTPGACAPRSSRSWIGSLVPVLFLSGLAVSMVSAQAPPPPPPIEESEESAEKDIKVLQASLFLTGEHDSNVNLGSGKGNAPGEKDPTSKPLSDTVYRIKPKLTLQLPFQKENLFYVDASGDLRRGQNENLSDLNGALESRLELKLPGGLSAKIYGQYLRSTFDLALYPTFAQGSEPLPEPGLSRSTATTFGSQIAYKPAERFSIEAKFERTNTKATFLVKNDTPPPLQVEQVDDRHVTRAQTRIIVPVAESWVAYADYKYQDQGTIVFLDRVYDDHRIVGGVRWGDPDRLDFWVEAGREKIAYPAYTYPSNPALPPNPRVPALKFNETVALAGVDWIVGDDSTLTASFGRDGYGSTVYQGIFLYAIPDQTSWRVFVQKSSQNSFSGLAISRILDATIVSGRFEKTFAEQVLFALEASFVEIEGDKTDGRDSVPCRADQKNWECSQKDVTLLGRGEIGYAFTKWLRLVAHVQASRRDSLKPSNEFIDRRFGASLGFVY